MDVECKAYYLTAEQAAMLASALSAKVKLLRGKLANDQRKLAPPLLRGGTDRKAPGAACGVRRTANKIR